MKKHKIMRLIFDFEKEEKWLNEMSAKGLHFISYTLPTYLFEEGRQGEYTYRIELLSADPSSAAGRRYINFVEETGVECVDTFWRWAYFRKKTSDGPFDMYTDYTSRIRHYRRAALLVGSIALLHVALLAFGVGSRVFIDYPLIGLPLVITIPLFTGLFFSYWKRAKRLKKEMKLHE